MALFAFPPSAFYCYNEEGLCKVISMPECAAENNRPSVVNAKWLSTTATLLLAIAAVASIYLAYEYEAAGGASVIYLACLSRLAWVKSSRLAFYLGLAIGFTIASIHLQFMRGLFGPAAVGLWAIFGIWIALFLLLARIVIGRWPRYGALWVPVIWLGLEYFRSELYYLRFAWLTPGFALSHQDWVKFAGVGMYGFSFAILTVLAVSQTFGRSRPGITAAILGLVFLPIVFMPGALGTTSADGPFVVGIQLEGASEPEILASLERAIRERPDLDVVVLSEYAFDAEIPVSVRNWCSEHQKFLVAGGKELLDAGGQFIDTVFVVSAAGEVVFQQGKAVPVQFFNDGQPAREQKVWESPWGKIGIAICYDLSYSRVIDRLVEEGAQALIIPTMDAEDWGPAEHRLHARIAPVRAREYGIPIYRLASSGISQLVNSRGRLVASAPFPGQGQTLEGRLVIGKAGRLPIDRYLAIPAVVAGGGLLVYLAFCRLRELTAPERRSNASRGNVRVV
jgi:apolipoprotein N-acyltransferase